MKSKAPYILFADDDPDDQEMLTQAFSAQHPDVLIKCVRDGRQLIDYLTGCTAIELPHLILLDYQMPILNAGQILQELEKMNRFKHIPKVIWSTSNRTEYVSDCINHGASHYFSKPNDLQQLAVVVDQLSRIYSQCGAAPAAF
jgi:CheY-like chemotaxis protein